MSNQKRSDSKSIFEKKGFYTALYSCIAIILVAAVGISYRSLWNAGGESNSYIPSESTKVVEEKPSSSQAKAGSSGNSTSKVQSPDEIVVEEGNVDDVLKAAVQGSVPAINSESRVQATAETTAQSAEVQASNQATEVEQSIPVSSNTQQALDLGKTATEQASSPNEAENKETAQNSSHEAQTEISSIESSALADPVFNTFSGNEDMVWPVLGEIVMEFSPDKLVYDKTLDQYRSNDTICIAANIGEQVKSAADGVVRSITNTRENGNTIVIEHGNGWFTTYSQLQDGILVEEGDVVTKNQVIGGVGAPSIYYVLLGSHLSFKVEKDAAPIDPSLVLALK